jgi:N-terminal acetyltransferase B complex non-catalytic subunit
MLIVDTSSGISGEKETLHLWLKQYLDSQKKSRLSNVESKGMTRSEDLTESTYQIMAVILRESRDREHWTETSFQDTLDKQNKNLRESLEKHLALIESLVQLVPAFGSTLHSLYTAHEVSRTVVNFCSYLSKQDKDFYGKQVEASTKIEELAQKLLKVVVKKCADIKKGLDEGGWIDKVLECALPYATDGTDGLVGASLPLVSSLRELLDENFMEEWAGEVVESWRDSVVGFSYLKAPSTRA